MARKVTRPKAAKAASKGLRTKNTELKSKTAGATALSQTKTPKAEKKILKSGVTRSKATTESSKFSHSKRTGSKSKAAGASVLSQTKTTKKGTSKSATYAVVSKGPHDGRSAQLPKSAAGKILYKRVHHVKIAVRDTVPPPPLPKDK
jgi:hypothetical protein